MKWIPVTERIPKPHVRFLAWERVGKQAPRGAYPDGGLARIAYATEHSLVIGNLLYACRSDGTALPISHWAELSPPVPGQDPLDDPS